MDLSCKRDVPASQVRLPEQGAGPTMTSAPVIVEGTSSQCLGGGCHHTALPWRACGGPHRNRQGRELEIVAPEESQGDDQQAAAVFLNRVSTEIDSMKTLHMKPHIAILLYCFEAKDSPEAGDYTHIPQVCEALRIDSTTCQKRLDECKADLLLAFPKQTPVGSNHSYVQFQKNPPGGTRGTVHVSQLCPFYEPPMGATWSSVETVFPQNPR